MAHDEFERVESTPEERDEYRRKHPGMSGPAVWRVP